MMSEVRGPKSLKNAFVGLLLACTGMPLASLGRLAAILLLLVGAGEVSAAACRAAFESPQNQLTFVDDASLNYCELCGYGYVTVRVTNPFKVAGGPDNPDMNNIRVQFNLGGSGLELWTGGGASAPAVSYRVNGGGWQTLGAAFYAATSNATNNTVSVGTAANSNPLDLLDAPGNNHDTSYIDIRIAVHRRGNNTPESLHSAGKGVTAVLQGYDVGCTLNGGDIYRYYNPPGFCQGATGNNQFQCQINGGTWIDPPLGWYDVGDRTYSFPQNASRTLTYRSPKIQVNKVAYNWDAGQRLNTASDTIHGHNDDDVIWRVQIRNQGSNLAPLQDLRIDDVVSGADLMGITHMCATQGAAETLANNNGGGAVPSGCVVREIALGTRLSDYDVDAPFGNSSNDNPYTPADIIDIPEGGSEANRTLTIWMVGKARSNASCTPGMLTNTVNDVQYGCDVQTPPGGLTANVTYSFNNQNNAAQMWARYGEGGGSNALRIERQLTSISGSGPVGTRGLMTITLRNESRGTVWFDPAMDYHLRDVLPSHYVIDPRFTPRIENPDGNNRSMYGAYPGRINTISWSNPQGAVPGDTADSTSYLNNTAPEFKLSSGTGPNSSYTDSATGTSFSNIMRHGDVIVIRFAVILKDPVYFDRAADLDIAVEDNSIPLGESPLNPLRDPDEGTDPAQLPAGLNNTLIVTFKTLCDGQGTITYTMTGNGAKTNLDGSHTGTPVQFAPEDLDVRINEPTFIITNDRTQSTPLSVTLTNNGGDAARNLSLFVTFGATMEVTANPPVGWSCAPILVSSDSVDGNGRPMGHPDPFKVWAVNPAPDQVGKMHMLLPTNGTVFQCTRNGSSFNATLGAGQSETFWFNARKTEDQAGVDADDLTFRADVVGEIFTIDNLTIANSNVTYNTAANGNRSIGSITINNPTAVTNGPVLWFPAPGSTNPGYFNRRSDGEVDRGNLYSLDAHWSRGIGFNLKKDQVTAGDTTSGNFGLVPTLGRCNENTDSDVVRAPVNTFPGQAKPAEHVQIGEECTVRIQTGGWFGFETRGFNFIGVRDIEVRDLIPDGQSYISSTVPIVTGQIAGATQAPNDLPSTPIDEVSPFAWRFTGNQSSGSGAPNEGTYIVDIEQWFTINTTSRILNKAPDNRLVPNVHGRNSVNVLDSSFEGMFLNNNNGEWEPYRFGNYDGGSTPGYPNEPIRRVDVVITEPRLSITKEVCNLSSAGGAANCTWGIPGSDAAEGSKFDDFIYRITVSNEASAEEFQRAPAYDVVITDVLENGQMCVWARNGAFTADDGIDNIPGDPLNAKAGMVGTAFGLADYDYDHNDPESSLAHCDQGVAPAQITFSYQHSDLLKQINPGDDVVLQYRVSPHRTVAPGQSFTNTADIYRYDSLWGDSGAQTVMPVGNTNHPLQESEDGPRLGGARIHCKEVDDESDHCASDSATVTILQVDVDPIEAIGQSTLGEYEARQGRVDAVVGEEIRLRLTGQVPASQLGEFTFHVVLPDGLRCIEAEEKNLRDIPGTTWHPSDNSAPLVPQISGCESAGGDGSFVRWEYGDQHLLAPSGLITVQVSFVARVENNNFTAHGANLVVNGSGDSYMSYLPPGGGPGEVREFVPPPITVHVNGPRIQVEKSFDEAVESIDGDDIVTVTVRATNTANEDGATSATAYNLQVLDDLRNTKYRYYAEGAVAGLNGTPAPQVRFADSDPNAPIFYWVDPSPNAPAGTLWSSPYAILDGGSVEFSFQVRVVGELDENADVEPHEELRNTIEAIWQSLPNRNLNLNIDPASQAGAIGIDGAEDGMRNGWFSIDDGNPNPVPGINDYDTSAEDLITVPGLTIGKADITDVSQYEREEDSRTIGAHREFELRLFLPEGVSNDVQIADNLAAAQTSFVLTRDGNYEVRCEYERILTINGDAPLESCNFAALPDGDSSGEITWNIGTVATNTEDDLENPPSPKVRPEIRIIYFARIDNEVVETEAGQNLRNTATVNYSGATAPVDAAPVPDAISATEPQLSVEKQAEPDEAVSGDSVQYTVTIRNASGTNVSTAYDVNIVDTLDPRLRFDESAPVTLAINGVPVPDSAPEQRGDNALVWGRENGDNSLDIPPDGELVLTYSAIVVSAFGGEIENTVYVDWTSLNHGMPGQEEYPGDYQRHGQGCPSVTAPNTYCTEDSATVETDDNTSFAKSAESLAWGDPDRARIGDTVEYTLSLILGLGTTGNVEVRDILPPGLQLVSVDRNDCESDNFTCSLQIGPNPGDSGELVWQLGDVQASASVPFNIVYTARVMNDSSAFPIGDTEVPRTNAAQLTYDNAAELLEAEATVLVVQPNITDLLKTDRRAEVTSPHTVMDLANEVMQFQLQACNTGGAPAYELVVSDLLNADPSAPQFNETSLNIQQVQIGGQPASFTPAPISNGELRITLDEPVPHGPACDVANSFAIDYEIALRPDIGSGQTWFNRFHADNYHSLDIAAPEMRQYSGSTPACENDPTLPNCFELRTPVADADVLSLQLLTPDNGLAPIGEEIRYLIRVPGSPIASSALEDVRVFSTIERLDTVVRLESITVQGEAFTPDRNGDELSFDLGLIPAGETRDIEITAWVDNHPDAQSGVQITNTAYYEYIEAGSTERPTPDQIALVTIVEPELELVKSSPDSGSSPVAGDILRFSLALSEQGANGATAHDLTVVETLTTGLAFVSGSVTYAGGALSDPAITGDGVSEAQILTWDSLAAMDIPAGENRTLEFEVRVLDGVLAGQELNGSTSVQWTSQPATPEHVERDGSDMPNENGLNNYFIAAVALDPPFTAANNNSLAKNHLGDTSPLVAGELRIGDIVEYELRLGVQKGTHPNAVVTDVLPNGVVFVETVSITDNGINYDLGGEPASGATGSIEWNLGDLVNSGNGDSDELVIVYRTRVQNDAHPLNVPEIPLENRASFAFDIANDRIELDADQTLALRQPDLSISLSANPDGSAPLMPGQEVLFTLTISNSGTAPAYDALFRDSIPLGMRNGGVETLSVSVNGSPRTPLQPQFEDGEALWNFGTGTEYEIPAGGELVMTYRVFADSDIAAGLAVQNEAQVRFYYSFDDDQIPAGAELEMRQVYGPTNTESISFSTPDAEPLAIAVQPVSRDTASIGEPFVYRLTIPATGALHDVVVRMDLSESAADLAFVEAVQVAGSLPFNPVGTVDVNGVLTIEDINNGIDIAAGDQAVIDVTLMLRDTDINVDGLQFTNRASYRYNFINGDPEAGQGMGEVSEFAPVITVVEPELTLEKSGPASIQSGLPGNFTLNVHNAGTGPAWDITLTDLLPNESAGGMCETPPDNFVAQIADGAGNPIATLNAGSDFTTAYDVESCTLTVTTRGENAQLAAGQRLLFSYNAYLDADTPDGAALTNIAGATLWHSWDSSGPEVRAYERVITDGTVGHEDAFTITAAVPSFTFEKSVINVTTAQNPGADATPGDRLRYVLTLRNDSDSLEVEGIAISDELDALNALPMFAPGSFALISAPPGADTSGTDAAGGAAGTGLLDVRELNLAAGESLVVEFEVTLVPVIDSGSIVYNQAQLLPPGMQAQPSDDPNIAGDEDPTQTRITSAPAWRVEKVSEDLTEDADILLPGDTLRYTLTVKNIGTENAVDVLLRDQVPANTTYVPNSTTLNGAAVADVDGGSPLAAGLLINAPENDTAGFMRADVDAGADNVATIVFDVTINDVRDGTIISNQGFVNGEGAGSGGFDEKPSDDPATPQPDDPTIDIVGAVPLLYALKTVELVEDNLSPGIVDPGDVLRYTFVVSNAGGVDATNVVLTDQLPNDTTYISGTTTLNGMAVTDSGGGNTRLDTGLPISSDDLTPPLPGAGEGVISSARSATVTFDVRVNAGTASGTVISNQGNVTTEEMPRILTDADGNPANGAQPTQVVVGDAQALTIVKEVAVVGGGAALPGATLEYAVRVTNIAGVPATMVRIYDDLAAAGEGVLTYVGGSATLNGQPTGVTFDSGVITAQLAGELAPGASATLRFQAMLGAGLQMGMPVTNTAEVQWNDPPASNSASVTIDVGGTPGIANLNGLLWHDINFNEVADDNEPWLAGWSVELYFNGALMDSVQADEDGFFQFTGLMPNVTSGSSYELKYIAPNADDNTASLGNTSSDFLDGPQHVREIFVGSGANPQNLNLPLTPNGVVYDSVLRQPISGARLAMLRASSEQPLPDACFDDPKQQNQVTQPGGYYKFDINFSRAECAAGNDYLIRVEVPNEDYVIGESLIIPAQTNGETAAFNVPACLGSGADRVPATAQHCEAQESHQAPGVDIDARDPRTDYYLKLTLRDQVVPGESQLFHNHIPLDPQLDGALSITKTAHMLNVTRSQLVPYTITFRNALPVPLTHLQLADFFPAGFKYVAGSARLDGEAVEPEIDGLILRWPDLRISPEQTREVKLLLVVGSGVGEAEYVNRARLFNQLSGQVASGEATATVRVVPDPTFDCTDVIGKVFDDRNMNGYQDPGESGVPGARVVTATGLNATTDAHGRFHITCAAVPDRDRGSNFILKLDDRSLPSGYRLTSENPRVVRATRGKAIKVNFGTSLHRVVRLDLAEGVFEPETTELRPQWISRTELLQERLREAPSVLRLSYLAENEDPKLVDARLAAMKARIAEEWAQSRGDYELTIETEVFWRRGAPPVKGGLE